eukprot:CAMPEP_0172898296 /NCGR_PEP_ID=MMETSP1075-20121228/159399_1 /TAXON_ID=2916 /ORGANISM="Ceratium fusus, Strain PA161109" /LENGTH=62 /DNA_ID=CAMNT_0013754053 /DNA_START=196 /DNA_END=384 /DNA_ORIENTATION=+
MMDTWGPVLQAAAGLVAAAAAKVIASKQQVFIAVRLQRGCKHVVRFTPKFRNGSVAIENGKR